MPPNATSLKRASGSARSVGQLRLPSFPKMPEKIRRIDADGATAYEIEVQRYLERLIDKIEEIRMQLPQP